MSAGIAAVTGRKRAVRRDYTNSLRADWSKRENDLMIRFPNKPDGHYLHGVLSKEVTDELKRRGYDIRTIRFSIMKDPNDPRWSPGQ